jgi:signal transduction histidine kinase
MAVDKQTVEAVRGLSKRVAAVGGHLCVGPVHSGGFRVRVTVPPPAAQQV